MTTHFVVPAVNVPRLVEVLDVVHKAFMASFCEFTEPFIVCAFMVHWFAYVVAGCSSKPLTSQLAASS
jgi:hypothetical protein